MLHQPDAGGETAFPSLNFKARLGVGDLLFWWNVLPTGDDADRTTFHEGREVSLDD